jgi:hypothetical protein
MSDRETIYRALHEAALWNDGLADAYSGMKTDPAYKDAVDTAKRYRALLRKRYGTDKTALDAMVEKAVYVNILDLQAGLKKS